MANTIVANSVRSTHAKRRRKREVDVPTVLKENSRLAGRSFFEGENVQEQPLAYTAVRAAPNVFPAEKFLTVSVKIQIC